MQRLSGACTIAITREERLQRFDERITVALVAQERLEGAVDKRLQITMLAQREQEAVDAEIARSGDVARAKNDAAQPRGVVRLGGGAADVGRRSGGIAKPTSPLRRVTEASIARGASDECGDALDQIL